MDPSSSKNPKKKRRVDDQLDSEPGPSSEVLPLVAPHLVKKSSKDPNRGLYPFRKPVKLGSFERHSSSEFRHGNLQSVLCKDDLQSQPIQEEHPPVANPTFPSEKSNSALEENFSSPQFIKASELRRRMPQAIQEQPPAANPTFSLESTKSNTAEESFPSPQFVTASELRKRMPEVIQDKSQSVNPVLMSTNFNSKVEKNSSLDRNVAENSTLINGVKSARKTFNSWELSLEKRKHRSKFKHVAVASKITKYFKMNASSKPQTVKAESRLLKTANVSKSECEPSTSQSGDTSGWKWMEKDESMLEMLAERDNEQFFKNYKDCYGLVDNSVPENTGKDYFDVLPIHIIETILCQIPILDLMTCRLVCSKWCEIIDGEKFMEWKKFYYRLKYRSPAIPKFEPKLNTIFQELNYGYTIEDGLRLIVKYMEVGFNRVPSTDMLNLLMKNPKGELAHHVLAERFPELSNKEKRVWCQFAIALLISETVWDIFNLYKSLFTIKSTCSRVDVTDAMYCVASFLLYFRIDQGLNLGLHYRLYYALYLIENHVPQYQREKLKIVQGLPGQQSMANYGKLDCSFLTYEQIRILNHKFDMNQKIRIVALAGTGKTSTLLYLAKLYPQIKFLNLVFNKSVNDEAKKKFPENVTCKTAHSLAYSAVGKFLKHKLTSSLRPYDLINHVKHHDQTFQIYAYANLVLSTITNFTLSSAPIMGIVHVPTKDFNRKSISITHQNNILKDAFRIWMMMLDRRNPFKITHDVYLKLYHLKRPKLNKYQCIMVDEAQDCNPVILDIVLSQTMPVIFVGDPNQQIYGFRGAQNALDNIGATHTYHLTKSFRFGPEISYIAHCILDCLLSNFSTTIIGNTDDSYFNGKVGGQYAVIARTNVVLFNEALRMVVFKRLKAYEPTVINAAFAGGFSSYGFDQISDIFRLKNIGGKNDKPTTDKFISRFKSYTDLVNYARYSDDSDLLSKIEIVNQHGKDIMKFISILKERCNHSVDTANVVFSTAHKSKGLEFDTVYLTDDYQISTVPGYLDGTFRLHLPSEYAETSREEAHILYVAVTRAKKHLLMQEKLNKVLHLAYEKFEYPVSSKSVLQNKASLRCVQCDASFKPHTVLMYMRRKVVMASGREIQEGPLCMKCGSDPQMRPDVHVNGLVMYLDAIRDNAHCFLSPIVGPLPGDPPIIHDRFAEFQNADRVFVINLNLH